MGMGSSSTDAASERPANPCSRVDLCRLGDRSLDSGADDDCFRFFDMINHGWRIGTDIGLIYIEYRVNSRRA
jgi:hypothetical protein